MTFWALSPSLFHSLQTSSPTALSATLPLSPASKPGPHFCAIFLRHAFHFSFHNNSSSPQNCYFALVLFIVVRCFFFPQLFIEYFSSSSGCYIMQGYFHKFRLLQLCFWWFIRGVHFVVFSFLFCFVLCTFYLYLNFHWIVDFYDRFILGFFHKFCTLFEVVQSAWRDGRTTRGSVRTAVNRRRAGLGCFGQIPVTCSNTHPYT